MRIITERYEGGLLVERQIADFGDSPPPDQPSVSKTPESPAGVVVKGPWIDLDSLKNQLP